MGSVSEEIDQFFDTRDDITSVSDSCCDCGEEIDCDCRRSVNSLPGGLGYEAWIDGPVSIHERRRKFLKWMGLVDEKTTLEEPAIVSDRVNDCSGAVLGSSGCDDSILVSRFSTSCGPNEDGELGNETMEGSFACRIRNLDDGTEFVVDEMGHDGGLRSLRQLGSGRLLTIEEFDRSLGISPLVQRFMQKGLGDDAFGRDVVRKQAKRRWLRRISAVACIVDRELASRKMSRYGDFLFSRSRAQLVKVKSSKKRSKELSALYMLQDIQAHKGSILTMKFSPDGEYLASGGEDGIVRVWKVVEMERSGGFDVYDTDPSHTYMKINKFSRVVPFTVNSEKYGDRKSHKKTSVIFPQKVFHILEKPIHEFSGHCGEVLDLSWSKNKHLLSSSVDKTVRLWQVGCEQCINVFSHSSYVTSIAFNPVDDNYFISGSIDGKVRIWEIPACQVVDWTIITEIVTAVCYCPDGKGGIVGSMYGDCRFYDLSDNHLQLYAEISLQGKKKSPIKRITGFQFSPIDPTKLMVTSGDSKVRILHGVDVICKYRGIRNTGSQIFATFTNDGKHIVSASEDSNVYVWNYRSESEPKSKPKSHWSCEHFLSNNVSVAIPWRSKMHGSYLPPSISHMSQRHDICISGERLKQLRFLSANHLPLSHALFSDSISRGAATWPEEKLHSLNSLNASFAKYKSEHKLLKSFRERLGGGFPPATSSWGMVFVTASWDGRIRSFQNYGLPN